MDQQFDENGQPVTPAPSAEEEQEVIPTDSEVANTPEDEDDIDEEFDDIDEEDQGKVQRPLHEIPRFQEVVASNRQMKDELKNLKRQLDAAEKYRTATPQEKAILDMKAQYGFADNETLEDMKRELLQQKDDMAFEKFLAANPEAAAQSEFIRDLAYTEKYQNASYETIWSTVNGNAGQQKKVIKKRRKTGMTAKGTPGRETAGGDKIFTRAEISKMDDATYEKNRKEIQKQMKEGLIK